MKAYPIQRHLLGALVALAASLPLAPRTFAVAYTWDGNGDSNAGGNWFTTANWNPDGTPAFGGDTATLGDVTTGTRTITISGGSTTGVSFVSFTQSTAGAVNLLSVQKTFSISNGIDLSATAGTEVISVGTGSSGNTLTVTGASTVGTNGILELQHTSSITGTGSLTLSGGTLNVAAVTGSGSNQASVGLDFAMSSGSIVIDNTGTGIVSDRRLAFSGNVNITGGTISSTRTATAGGIFLNGATNVISPVSFDGDLVLYIAANGDQSLTTNQSFAGAGITLRGYGTKTITSTGGGAINTISFIDTNSSSSVGTTLKLGSDLTLASGATQPFATNFSQTVDTSSAIQLGIDTNGFTLDLSAGASSGVFTPANSAQVGVTTTTWTLSNSGAAAGGFKANAFNLSSSGSVVNVGANVILRAVGGNGTASNLGSSGTFASTASFVYDGGAAAGTPATLTSGRTIGSLVVKSGALQITGSAFNAAGGITVNSGALLDFSAQTVSAAALTVEVAGLAAGQIKTGTSAYNYNALTFNFTATPVAGTLDLFNLGTGGAGTGPASVTLSGLYSASLSGVSGVWTGTAGGYDFSFSEATGDLTVAVSAIPEPSTFAALAGLAALGLAAWRRHARG